MAEELLQPAQSLNVFWRQQKFEGPKVEPSRRFINRFLRVSLLSVPQVASFRPRPTQIALRVGLALAA